MTSSASFNVYMSVLHDTLRKKLTTHLGAPCAVDSFRDGPRWSLPDAAHASSSGAQSRHRP